MSGEKKGKVAAMTLGCKVNAYDTEAMLALFMENGYEIVPFHTYADVYIVNTCTVTRLGDKKSRQMLRRARTNNPHALVVAAGCYAQVSPEEAGKLEEVNLVVGTAERGGIVEAVENARAESGFINAVSDVMKVEKFEELPVQGMRDKTRAYIKIQEGCDRFCAYCIVPYARGPVRSRLPGNVVEEAERFAGNGYRELVLSGIHVASYGKDLTNIDLLRLLPMVHGIEGIRRIRFSSLDPCVVTEEFVQVIAGLPKICDHFHLSLQSGCDATLKRMNRKYTADEYAGAVGRLRKLFPDVALTTDVIVGFPGETDEDFDRSYRFAEEMKLAKIHVFPYSAKKGTAAADMTGQIEPSVKEQRSQKMLALSESLEREFIDKAVGSEREVLFEKRVSGGLYQGHTTNYIMVTAESERELSREIKQVRLVRRDGFCAYAVME